LKDREKYAGLRCATALSPSWIDPVDPKHAVTVCYPDQQLSMHPDGTDLGAYLHRVLAPRSKSE
jgi:hypothetical protein